VLSCCCQQVLLLCDQYNHLMWCVAAARRAAL
jgi:hypothetical protein